MRKGLIFLLALILSIVCAAYAEQGSEWIYSSNQGGIGRYEGAGGEVTVPETAEGYAVRTVGDAVFLNNAEVTGLTVPECVRSLGSSCLNNCENLERVTLSEGLQSIEYNNFHSLPNLKELTIPASVAVIDYSISWCESLSKITFLGECPVFSRPDFCLSVLSNDLVVYVPDDQLEAYRAALINLEEDQIQPSGQPAVRYDWTPAPETLTFDAQTGTITGYTGDALRVDLPAEIDGTPVKAIGMYAFERSRVVYVDIPEGVTEIESMAFEGSNDLNVLRMPDSLKKIGSYAFDGMDGYNVSWGSGLEEIGDGAFQKTYLGSELNLPAGLRVIGDEAFRRASLRDVHIGGAIEKIGERAFANTNLNYLELDAYSMIDAAADAFADTYLEDVDLPWDSTQENQLAWQALIDAQVEGCKVWINNPTDCDYPENDRVSFEAYDDGTLYLSAYTGERETLQLWHTWDHTQITGLGDGVFRDNQTLKKYRVTHSDQFKTIGAEAFAGSAVETVDLYYTTETIGAEAFRDCLGLTEITLPASLKSVGAGAFRGCANLKDVTILCDPAILPEDVFEGTAYTAEPVVEMPMEASPEGDFEFDADTGMITAYLGDAVDVVIPRTIGGAAVRGIRQNAFDRARDYTDTDVATNRTDWLRLRSVVIPETVETIEDSAFSYCQQLKLVVCYAPLKSTGRATFMLCRGLRDVLFVNGVKEIDNYCFESCTALERVCWGNHLRRIGVNAFNRMGLASIVIDAEIVDEGVFNHSALREVTLTDRVKEIHSGAFYACENLNAITCLFSEAERFVDGGPFGGVPQTGVTTVFPASTTEDQLKALKSKLNIWNGGHLGNGNEITLLDVDAAAAEMPDPEALWRQTVSEPLPVAAPAATEEPAPAPAPAPQDSGLLPVGDIDAAMGVWKLRDVMEGGETMAAEDIGFSATMTLNADGTGVMDVEGEMPLTWYAQDGFIYMNLTGVDAPATPIGMNAEGCLVAAEDGLAMIFARDDDSLASPAAMGGDDEDTFVPARPEQYLPMVGQWYGVWVDSGGGQFNPIKDMDYLMLLTVNADGTATLNDEDRDPVLKSYNGHVMFGEQSLELIEDGKFLHLGQTASGSAYFCQDPEAEIPEKYRHAMQEYYYDLHPETPPPAAAPKAEELPGELLMDVKYLATSYQAGGYSYDAAILGAEYSVTLHANGTCEFVMSGFTVPGVTWYMDGETVHIAYAAGYDCALSGSALELDFSGAMVLHMEPQV